MHPHKGSQFFQYANDSNKTANMIGVKRDKDGNLSLLPENHEVRSMSLSASPFTGEFAFVSNSISAPKNERGRFNIELYIAGDGVVTQLTDLRTHMAWANLSYDGSRIAFAADKTRRKQWDVWYYDRTLGKAFKTGIRDPTDRPSDLYGLGELIL